MIRMLFLFIALVLFPAVGMASDTACARVSIEILQELTLERVAFDARMVIHNNLTDRDLQNVRVDVTIQDADGNVKNELFFVKVSSLHNIDGVAGDGTVTRNTSAEAHWLIIPSPGAGGDDPAGVPYFIGATLTYTLNGEQEILPINPDRITVRPTAQLYLDYFMPYDVLADNPFTAQVEAPIPFPLAVRVLNDGFGPANKLKIDSAQPKIIDNEQGLLIDFKLLGAAVNDSAVSPSLVVDMGNVDSKDAATGYWEMISTLSGRFIEFDVSFTHDSELGGELTSLIKETNAHYLTHRMKVNLPGRDGLLDFLADTDEDNQHLPDAIFESEIPSGGLDRNDARAEVTVVQPLTLPIRPTPEEPEVQTTVNVSAHAGGWIYSRMDDPSQGLLKLENVVRADGVALDPHNFWIEEGLNEDYKPIFTLQFVDYRANTAAPGSYKLVFTQPAEDFIPPTTILVFDGPAVEGETTYLTPETRVVLTARDNEEGSGVEQMFKKVGDETAFAPALPFNLGEGSYSLEYYSVDRAGNVEATKLQSLLVDETAPLLTEALIASPSSFSPQAPAGVSSARQVSFTFTAEDSVPELSATLVITDASGAVVRTLQGSAVSGTAFELSWDGRDSDGNLVAAGSYSANLTLDDGLDHLTNAQTSVTVADWFAGVAVDPVAGGNQLYPAVSGTKVVWQDDRNGHTDIYLKDLADLSRASTRITSNEGGQEHPAIDAELVVWQDDRNGDFDIYAYDLASKREFAIYQGAGEQTAPVVAGDWIAWQDNRSGNWDIYLWNRSSDETVQVTSHERDQVRPALSAETLVWEDYRHGLGEIYRYELTTGEETRLTIDINNQFLPVVDGNLVVWTDQRDGQQEIYRQSGGSAQRLTYGSGDRSQASLADSLLVYTDFSNGSDDPNLGFLDLSGGNGGVLTSHSARQEEPAAGDGVVAWQDDRDGTPQIYMAALELTALPVSVDLASGFNLVAVGQKLVDSYGSAAELISALAADIEIERVLTYSAAHGQFFEADPAAGDFALVKGSALVVYTASAGNLPVAEAGEETVYSLLAGINHLGILNAPVGYRAYDLLRSLGLENVISVRCFDTETGLWRSAAVRETENGPEIVGINFEVHSGDGLVVTMTQRVDGWMP